MEILTHYVPARTGNALLQWTLFIYYVTVLHTSSEQHAACSCLDPPLDVPTPSSTESDQPTILHPVVEAIVPELS